MLFTKLFFMSTIHKQTSPFSPRKFLRFVNIFSNLYNRGLSVFVLQSITYTVFLLENTCISSGSRFFLQKSILSKKSCIFCISYASTRIIITTPIRTIASVSNIIFVHQIWVLHCSKVLIVLRFIPFIDINNYYTNNR